jgi:hypothetical protein
MKSLHRAAGRFTVLKGTNRILHFVEAISNAIHASTDMYEVVLFRALRRSVRAGHVTAINPDGSSFYLLMASMLHRMATRTAKPINRIRHLNAKLGAEFEGLKLFAEVRKSEPLWFDALFPSRAIKQDFDILHRRIDRFESSVRIGETKVSDKYLGFRSEQDAETIDVIDWFKEHPVPIQPFLAERFAEGSQTQRLFAVIRCGWDERIDVQDLFDEAYTLPSMTDLRSACADLGLFGSALFLHDFDRDFLLPFEGTYGLALLYVTRQADDIFEEAGFRDLADEAMGQQRAVVTTDQLEQPRSYDELFSTELPELEEPGARDWTKWKADRDWDPGALDWKTGAFRGDAMIIPVASHSRSEPTTKIALSLLADTPDAPWLSTEGMLHAAAVLREGSPLESFYAIFTALDRAEERPRIVGYILEGIQYRAGGGFSEIPIRDLEDGPTLSFTDASRLLCTTLREMGWLDDALNRQFARDAIGHALKTDTTRRDAALAGLEAAIA